MKKRTLTTYVAEDVYTQLVRESIKEDRSVASIVRRKLQKQMKKEKE